MHIKHIDAKNGNYYHASQNACIQPKEKLNKLGHWKSEIQELMSHIRLFFTLCTTYKDYQAQKFPNGKMLIGFKDRLVCFPFLCEVTTHVHKQTHSGDQVGCYSWPCAYSSLP